MKIKEGLVFKIKVDETHYMYGQVLKLDGKHLIDVILFNQIFEAHIEVNSCSELRPFIFMNTMKIRFKSGEWVKCFYEKVNYSFEAKFKVLTLDGFRLVDSNLDFIRDLSEEEAEQYGYKETHSPVTLDYIADLYYHQKMNQLKQEYEHLIIQ